jgi:hypothetical protein
LDIKCIISPRQARDKHRKTSKKEWLHLRRDGSAEQQQAHDGGIGQGGWSPLQAEVKKRMAFGAIYK